MGGGSREGSGLGCLQGAATPGPAARGPCRTNAASACRACPLRPSRQHAKEWPRQRMAPSPPHLVSAQHVMATWLTSSNSTNPGQHSTSDVKSGRQAGCGRPARMAVSGVARTLRPWRASAAGEGSGRQAVKPWCDGQGDGMLAVGGGTCVPARLPASPQPAGQQHPPPLKMLTVMSVCWLRKRERITSSASAFRKHRGSPVPAQEQGSRAASLAQRCGGSR